MSFNERTKPTTIVKALMSSVPYVLIAKEAVAKMFHYVNKCGEEIGWLGTAYRDGQEIIIEDVYLFDQEVHATTTEITPEGLSTFAMELMQQPDGVDIWNNLKVWGHSHVNMGVTPSVQDDKQMETFKEGGHDWFIRLIANKKGELKLDLYDYTQGIIFLDIPWYHMETEEESAIFRQIEELQKQIDALNHRVYQVYDADIAEEMKVKVRKKTYATGSNCTARGNTLTTPSTGEPAKTSGKSGTAKGVSALDSKKKETNANGNAPNNSEDYFKSDDEVRETFSATELIEFSYEQTLATLEQLLWEFGWYDCFTDDDLERILRVSKKVFWNIGGETNER